MPISQYDVLNYANYKPASLQDMFAPAEAMRQQEDKLQEEYAQQEQLGSLSLNNIDKVKDKKAYDIKQNYMQKTKEASDLLATKGIIDSGRRRELMNLKGMYNNQVIPYMNALAVRQAKSAEYSKITTDHPDWLGLNPTNKSLDDYLTNPNVYDYTGLKGDVLKKAASDDAGQYADQNLKTVLGHNVVPFKKLLTKYRGASINETLAAIHDNFDSKTANAMTTVLHNIRETTMDKYGVKDKLSNDPEQMRKAYEYIDSGILSAMGKTEQGTIDDSYNERKALEKAPKTPPYDSYKRSLFESPVIMNTPKYKLLEDIRKGSIDSQTRYEKAQAHPFLAQLAGSESIALSKPGMKNEYGRNMQKIYDLARKNGIQLPSWTTKGTVNKKDLNEFINGVVDYAQLKLKSSIQSKLFTTEDKFPEKNVLNMARSLNIDLSDLKDSNKELKPENISLHRDPITGGLTISNGSKEKNIGYQVLGNPYWVKNSKVQEFDKYNKRILNGNLDINELTRDGLVISDIKNKGHYMFADPRYYDINSGSNKQILNSYTPEELQDAYSDPEISSYLNGKNYEFNSAIESNLTSQNKGNLIGNK